MFASIEDLAHTLDYSPWESERLAQDAEARVEEDYEGCYTEGEGLEYGDSNAIDVRTIIS